MDSSTYDLDTIKNVITKKDEAELWTKPIEETILTEDLTYDFISSGVIQSPDSYKAIYNSKTPVYPSIKDFGSIDLTTLNENCRQNIKNFCENISFNFSDTISEYFNSDYIFNAVFFINDLKNNWGSRFNSSFPNVNAASELKLFDSYYIGQPLFSEENSFAEVPLLFISQNKKLYVTILINPEEEKIIYQAHITKWEIVNDK